MWYWGANKEEDNLGFEAWVQLVASLIQSFVQDGCILGVLKNSAGKTFMFTWIKTKTYCMGWYSVEGR